MLRKTCAATTKSGSGTWCHLPYKKSEPHSGIKDFILFQLMSYPFNHHYICAILDLISSPIFVRLELTNSTPLVSFTCVFLIWSILRTAKIISFTLLNEICGRAPKTSKLRHYKHTTIGYNWNSQTFNSVKLMTCETDKQFWVRPRFLRHLTLVKLCGCFCDLS